MRHDLDIKCEDDALTDILHIVAQEAWHDPALIVGTKAAIRSLRDALDRALAEPHDVQIARTFADDGEGYRIFVRVVSAAEMAEMPFSYTADMALTDNYDRFWPDWAIPSDVP